MLYLAAFVAACGVAQARAGAGDNAGICFVGAIILTVIGVLT